MSTFQPHEVCRYCLQMYHSHTIPRKASCKGLTSHFLPIIKDRMEFDVEKTLTDFIDSVWENACKSTYSDIEKQVKDYTHLVLSLAFTAAMPPNKQSPPEDEPMQADEHNRRNWNKGWNAANEKRREREREIMQKI